MTFQEQILVQLNVQVHVQLLLKKIKKRFHVHLTSIKVKIIKNRVNPLL